MDAYFEAMSGFTATGATVLTDIEAVDSSLLMWRQLSQWLGGMGIIVLAVAILPRLRIGGRQLLHSELAGPTEVERLSATIRETARRLWVLYLALTLVAIAVFTIYGWTGSRPDDEPLPGDRPRLLHALDRRVLDPERLDRGLRTDHAVDDRRPARARRRELPAPLPRARARTGARREPGRRVPALPRLPGRRRRRSCSSSSSAATSSAAGRPFATASSRRSRS